MTTAPDRSQPGSRTGRKPGTDGPATSTRVFTVLFLSVFSATMGLGIIVPLLPFYAESLGATGIWIGAIFAGFSLSRAVVMPIIGSVSDRRGRKWFIVAGLVIYTVLSLAYIAVDSVFSLTGVRILHGIASAMVIPIAMAYVADFSPEGREGKYMGTFMASLFLGMGFGPFIGGVLKDTAGMDAVFYAMSFFSFISLIICLVFLPDTKGSVETNGSLRETLKNRFIRPVLFFRVMNSYAHGTFMVFLPLLAAHSVIASRSELSSGEIGTIISLAILTMALLQRTFGKIADRYNKPLLIVVGTLLLSTALLVFPFIDGFLPTLMAALFFGIGSGIAIPSSTSLVTIAGRSTGQGAAMGAFNTAMSIGMITAPLISGAVMDLAGLTTVFTLAAIISAISAALFYRMASRAGLT